MAQLHGLQVTSQTASCRYLGRNEQFDPLPDDPDVFWSLPVVVETYDGDLNDINGSHVRKVDAIAALETARSGAVAEGNTGPASA